jgi:oligosaccharide reducing-end xylanase
MFDPATHLVWFVPNLEAHSLNLTDPSYHLPHFHELWARWADKDNAFWCDAASASRRFLRRAAHPVTGLTADYTTFDGTPKATWWNRGANAYRFDSFRVAGNVGVDYAWFARDTAEVGIATRQQDFFFSQGLNSYVNQYSVDGHPEPGAGRSSGQWAMNAVASLASASPHRADFVRVLWTMAPPSGLYRYYDGLLYTLALLETSGNFRAYGPEHARLVCP